MQDLNLITYSKLYDKGEIMSGKTTLVAQTKSIIPVFINERHYIIILTLILFTFLGYGEAIQDTIEIGKEYDYFQYTKRNGKSYQARLPKNRNPRDYTPIGFTKQPSFIRGGGSLNRHEHAWLFYIDGDVIPFTPMLGYRWGWFYWWDYGIDIGFDAGIFQILAHTRIENIKTRKSEFFFWANALKTGYKVHEFDYKPELKFDDKSWLTIIENSLGFRFGEKKRKVLYLNTLLYIDYDLHNPRRQTDYYIIPAALGFESMIGEHANIFVEIGMMYGITGMAFADGSLLYHQDWFPVFKLGTALRTGKKTAIYYTRETGPLSRGKQPK